MQRSDPRRHSPQPVGHPDRVHTRSVVAVIGFLAAWNVAGNLVVPDAWYVPSNLIAGLVIGLLVFRGGGNGATLGLEPDRFAEGWRLGLKFGAGAVVLIVIAAALPQARRFLEDDRFVGVAVPGLLYQVLLRIPIGTALFEEIAFRGALFGMLNRRFTTSAAAVSSSLLFGLWHVVPTLTALDTNAAGDLGSSAVAMLAVVAGGVVVTALAGLGFVWLRLRGNSLIAPIVTHAALNCTAYAVGWSLVSS
jgi:membrane protease YdiL (CAAX protease family)